MVEDVEDGLAQGLRAVDADQDRSGDVQAAVAQPGEQVGDDGGVLGRAFDQGEGVLGPVGVDAQRDDADRLAEVHAVDHQRDQVQAGQVGGQQLRERGLGHRHELP